ncbi:MAG: PEP-CTERM sorting domain-containing protein [Armatimonadetes bacterium]|nr:PEP-CTERM sorting domain-containing protein [Armatimonadota bacterium]
MKTFAMVLLASLLVAGHSQVTLISSTFDTDDEGWNIFSDGRDFQWVSNVGNPPGSVFAIDITNGQWWYFRASDAFLRNKSAAYGGTLSWQINCNARDASNNTIPDVVLIGAGMTLVYDLPQPVVNVWHPYSVSLVETAGWRINSFTGAVPTEAQFRAVLANLTAMRLRGEFRTGADQAYLDNVAMTGFCPSQGQMIGDLNGDRIVDDTDLSLVLEAFGQTGWAMAEDTNCDGIIDDIDLANVLENFGRTW